MPKNLDYALSMSWVSPAAPDSKIVHAYRKLATLVPIGRVMVENEQITIRARNEEEFNISIIYFKPHFIVSFDDWHEDFDDLESAIRLVSQAFQGLVRLRVDRIGGRPWRWAVENKNRHGRWAELHVKSVFMMDWGRAKDTVYRVIGNS